MSVLNERHSLYSGGEMGHSLLAPLLAPLIRVFTGDPKTPSSIPKARMQTGRAHVIVYQKFKLVFLTIVAITVGCGLLNIALAAVWIAPTPDQRSTFEAIGFAWKAGIGAIFGLLGGKAS